MKIILLFNILIGLYFYIISLSKIKTVAVTVFGDCPHEEFLEKNICDSCRGWREVIVE